MSTTTSPETIRPAKAGAVAGLFAADALDPPAIFEAEAFDRPWNGWATPRVTAQTLEAFAERVEGLELTWEGDVARVAYTFEGFEGHEMLPDSNGLYAMGEGGWCLDRVDDVVERELRLAEEHVTLLGREPNITLERRPNSLVLIDALAPDRVIALGPLYATAGRAESVVGWQVVTRNGDEQSTEQIPATCAVRLWDALEEWQHPMTSNTGPGLGLDAPVPTFGEHGQGPAL